MNRRNSIYEPLFSIWLSVENVLMRRASCFLLILLILVFFEFASADFNRGVLEDADLNIQEVYERIQDLSHTYHFLWVSDLHIVIDNNKIVDDMHDFVKSRQENWAIGPDGKKAGDWWTESLAETIYTSKPDAILFGGDMIDLCSEAAVEKLLKEFEKITVPWIYIRADHDYGTHWLKEPDREKNNKIQDAISENGKIITLEYSDFIILGINNTSQM